MLNATTPAAAGFKEYTNNQFPPHFTAQVPSGWVVEERPLSSQTGGWVSLQTPAQSNPALPVALDIQLIQRTAEAKYQSLERYAAEVLKQESIGAVEINAQAARAVQGMAGWESKITMKRTLRGARGQVEVTVVKQWVILPVGQAYVVVFLEAPAEDFAQNVAVYEKLLATLAFKK